jgi:quercetin dioxygenase-like cupin family protein
MKRALWAFGDRMSFVLTGADTEGRCFVMEQIVPRHTRPPGRHRHANEDHVWYIQAGQGRFYVDNTMTEAWPGAILWGPRAIPHAFSADSEELRVLVVTVPAGLEAFFEAIGEPARGDGPPPPGWEGPDVDEADLATRFGIELLGPEPQWRPLED